MLYKSGGFRERRRYPPWRGGRAKSLRKASLSVSEILRIDERAQEMRRSGRDVIILGAGEPDFDTPIHVKEAEDMQIFAMRMPPTWGICRIRTFHADRPIAI